jgi:hypothetical protein
VVKIKCKYCGATEFVEDQLNERTAKIINDLNVVNAKLDLLLKTVDQLLSVKEVNELSKELIQIL